MKSTAAAVDVRKNEVDTDAALVPLSSLSRWEKGWICEVSGEETVVRRLLEMGFVESAFVEVLHEAPFGKDPIAVRVRGATLALRRHEAQCVLVRKG
jgi:Fe2+ transport system protein A